MFRPQDRRFAASGAFLALAMAVLASTFAAPVAGEPVKGEQSCMGAWEQLCNEYTICLGFGITRCETYYYYWLY
jgi:hypothetical protein